ncbi:FprA family A-type flavoprotein [Desulfovibrio litoralis]|uniref:Flavorubredoxin n=1 Tax=Desulfovibrio litoralis DSM 11393 TaxID=1121455 RepID=A0A1M7S7J2_9BACT|nr:FprA family A-type flavoprotein [Desulfovibrio litoralis]SHN54436.1 Flavorubredoxin [Desulfovibrio litoralis DSM 11393]
MQPLEIKKDIFWVGAVDYNSRDFHGYSLSPQGSTYNAYLVKDEKNVLFDTVKAESADTMLCRLQKVIDLEKIDYIVVNHVELDHSGSLPKLVELCKPEKIFCSVMGKKSMEGHFNIEGWPIQVVKTGDVVNIGKRNIHFVETRMLHWPDSMFSYLAEDKLVICNDAFGQNIASSERFADEISRSALDFAVKEYYYNIVLPFSPQVLKTLELVKELKLDIDMLAPDHGLIFRGKEEVQYILDRYKTLAEQKPQKRALVVYDTMWKSTKKLAYSIASGFEDAGVPVQIMDLKQNHHSAVMTALADCGALVVGSPTHNNTILPTVTGFLSYMKGLRPQNRIGGAFGSFGWSGESVKIISEWLESAHFELPVEPVKCQFVPKHETYKLSHAMGKTLGEALIKKCQN